MSRGNPTVSVCMPNYNYGRFIGEAIHSVLNQDFEDFELIIVDDASTDNSVSAIKTFSDFRIRFYHNKRNIGRLKNINKCISLSRGEYITILPSDGIYAPRSLAKRVQLLNLTNSVGLVFSAGKIIDETGASMGEIHAFHNDVLMKSEEAFRKLILGNYVLALTAMVRKDCYLALGSFNEEVASGSRDWEMWLRVALNYDVAYIDEQLASERMHSGNITNYQNDININGMNRYMVIKSIFSSLQEEKKHLAPLEAQALKVLSKKILRTAGSNLINGRPQLARKNVGLAIAIDDTTLYSWKTYSLLFLTLFGRSLRILNKTPLLKAAVSTFKP